MGRTSGQRLRAKVGTTQAGHHIRQGLVAGQGLEFDLGPSQNLLGFCQHVAA